jgi:hypothetical protein
LREETHRYLAGTLTNLHSPPLLVGGAEDHVHLLCNLSRTCEPAKMVQDVKRSSSAWLKTRSPAMSDFAWQGGYAMFSLGFSQVGAARKYIANQEEHHRTVSFQDELREFLRRYQTAFDERYLWD